MGKERLIRSTGIIAASTLVSRIMGFVRDMIVANFFGASSALDGFFVAFRIPNLLRRLVAEGALTISFIPVYTEYLVQKGEDEALELAQKTLAILLFILTGLVGFGIMFSPEIVSIFAYGFTDADIISLTVSLNRIMFPYLFLVGLVAFSMGVLNSHGYFFAPAFSPVLLNVGFILGAVFLGRYFEEPLYGLALGVLAGGVMQVVLQVPYMIKSGFRMKLSLDVRHPGIRRIFRLIAPALFGIAVYQINILMSTVLASMLPSGSISYLYYSDRLTELVLGIFIVSIGNVLLPEMSRAAARDDIEQLKRLYTQSIKAALFLAIPAGTALMTVGLPVISVLFLRGAFTPQHAALTYKALFYASMGIASISILRITTPTFFSLQDTKTPVICAAVSFVLNISLGYVLMQTDLKHAGLSLANSISVTVQIGILVAVLRRKVGKIATGTIVMSVVKFTVCSAAMGVLIYTMAGRMDWIQGSLAARVLYLGLIVLAGGGVYLVGCILTGVEEVRYLWDVAKRRFKR